MIVCNFDYYFIERDMLISMLVMFAVVLILRFLYRLSKQELDLGEYMDSGHTNDPVAVNE